MTTRDLDHDLCPQRNRLRVEATLPHGRMAPEPSRLSWQSCAGLTVSRDECEQLATELAQPRNFRVGPCFESCQNVVLHAATNGNAQVPALAT